MLCKYFKYFDDFYCDLVEIGEYLGVLEIIYDWIVIYKEKVEVLKFKIKKVMFYFIVVLVVVFIVIVVLFIFVVF